MKGRAQYVAHYKVLHPVTGPMADFAMAGIWAVRSACNQAWGPADSWGKLYSMLRMVLLWPLKVGAISLVLWYFLRERLPAPGDWIAAVIAGMLLHLAYAAAMTGIRRSGDSRLLAKARSGQLPEDGRRSAFIGTIHADEAALLAPFSRAECVGYSYEIYHLVYTAGTKGSSGTTTKVVDFSGIALAPCSILTGVGGYRLLAYPFLSGFPEQKFKDEPHRELARQLIRTTSFEKISRVLGELTTLNSAMLETQGSLKKDWRIADTDELGECTFQEQCIPVESKVCAFGMYSDEKHSLLPNTSSDERALLLVAGDAEQATRQLNSGIRSSRRLAVWTAVPTVALLAFMLFAPWSMLRAVPGGAVIIEKQTARLKDALGRNDVAVIADAIRYVDPNLAFEEGARTPLMLATSVEAAQVLMDRGASIDAHDVNGYSVLMNAAERGTPELLRFLTSRGANVNERLPANPETTALTIARDRNTPAAVDALVKAGATDDAPEKEL